MKEPYKTELIAWISILGNPLPPRLCEGGGGCQWGHYEHVERKYASLIIHSVQRREDNLPTRVILEPLSQEARQIMMYFYQTPEEST